MTIYSNALYLLYIKQFCMYMDFLVCSITPDNIIKKYNFSILNLVTQSNCIYWQRQKHDGTQAYTRTKHWNMHFIKPRYRSLQKWYREEEPSFLFPSLLYVLTTKHQLKDTKPLQIPCGEKTELTLSSTLQRGFDWQSWLIPKFHNWTSVGIILDILEIEKQDFFWRI